VSLRNVFNHRQTEAAAGLCQARRPSEAVPQPGQLRPIVLNGNALMIPLQAVNDQIVQSVIRQIAVIHRLSNSG